MSWVMLDDKFHSHAKTAEVGNVGAGLFARALSYCGDHLTDGFVSRGWAHEIGRRPLCLKLVAAGFWIAVEAGAGPFVYVLGEESYTVEIERSGYFIPDYLISNPNRAAVLAKRDELSKKRSEAGKKGAASRWQRHGNGDGKTMATAWQPDGPLPLTPNNEVPNGTSLRVIEPNHAWDWLVEVKGEPLPKQRAGYGRIVSDLNALLDRESVAPIDRTQTLRDRAAALGAEWGEAKATPRALVENWQLAARLAAGQVEGPRSNRPLSVEERLWKHADQLESERRSLEAG